MSNPSWWENAIDPSTSKERLSKSSNIDEEDSEGLDVKFTRHETGKSRHLRLCYSSLRDGFFSRDIQKFSPSGDVFDGDGDLPSSESEEVVAQANPWDALKRKKNNQQVDSKANNEHPEGF